MNLFGGKQAKSLSDLAMSWRFDIYVTQSGSIHSPPFLPPSPIALQSGMVNPDGGNMDVLTGRITREVYFDPSKLIGKDGKVLASTVDETKQAEMLYKPVKVVQELASEKIVLVRDEFDQVHRLTSEGLLTVKAEAKEGVPDILDLNDFSGEQTGAGGSCHKSPRAHLLIFS